MCSRIQIVVLCLLFVISANAAAQYSPVPGGEDLTDLYSPEILAESGPISRGAGPQSDALNPAISGLVQRTTLDASYIGLTAFGDRASFTGWQGHVANLGLVSPTRAGVFSASFHVLTSSLVGMPLGSSGWIHGSAAKELYPGWLVGAGVRLGGGIVDTFDFGVGLDLGMLRLAGTLGRMEDFRWGVALQNLGKWYDPFALSSAMPSPFTLAGGASATAYSNDWLRLESALSVSAPSFRNLRGTLSGRLTFFDLVTAHVGWRVDLRQLIDPAIDRRSLIPSFGLSGVFRTGLGNEGFAADRGWTETEIHTNLGAAPLYNGIWAIGGGINAPLGIIDTEGPVVELDYTTERFISPNNDGAMDALSVPAVVTDERFIMNWRFEISSDGGDVIRTIRNKDERPENEGFQSFVDRIVDVRSGIQIPAEIRWDGSTDGGEVAPDGVYEFQMFAEDDNGNIGQSGTYRVTLDTTAPSLSLAADGSLIFSPNADGNKDTLAINQSGSEERRWDAAFVSALGREIRTIEWVGAAPDSIEWDGRGDSGDLVPDGVYRYRISAVDEAGNSVEGEITNIILNTEATPVSVSIDTSYFSPNGDGVLDTIDFTPVIPNTTGITSWEMAITDSGRVVASISGSDGAPQPFTFDGTIGRGSVIPEGTYQTTLSVVYENGNTPSAQSPPFTVDVTPPTVAVQSDRTLFSPNGDDKLDTVTFFQETSREELWIGSVATESGAVIRQVIWPTLADQQVIWNGRQDDGRMAVDGTYIYSLESTDLAGNRSASRPIEIVLDTSDAEIGVSAEFEAFSPNADNVVDRQRLFLRVDRSNDVQSYRVSIQDTAGSTVRTFEGRTVVQDSVMWDGTSSLGRRATDGSYRAVLDVVFVNGTQISAQTAEFLVDTTVPSVTVTTPYLLFSPDGDGERESIRIVQTSSVEEQWTGTIVGSEGVVREFVWAGRVSPVDWDGRDAAGNVVPDGSYRYTVSSADRAGNSVTANLDDIMVDSRQPRLFVTASSSAFSPNSDGIRDDFSIDMYANLLDGASGWSLVIRNLDGLAVREFDGTELVDSRTVSWDGTDGRGTLREGEFTAEFSVDYEKGNRPRAVTGTFRVDVTPPEVDLSLIPLPFSPDNDGVDDELEIRLSVQDASDIRAWRFEILDRNDRFFNEFAGQGQPAGRLIWDGRASDGELVISAEDYPYRLTVGDELGNITTEEGVIPVDILVIRDGDRLKVQISSITFAPNSPDLIVDPNDERGAKNRAILLRLGEIFDKYSSYSIRIEGHAVNVTGTEREEREELEPLSLSRAQSVMDAMVELGINSRRVSVLGRGGTEPIVPHTDEENRWKNRRVEFVLIR